jgi:hypothetical protein
VSRITELSPWSPGAGEQAVKPLFCPVLMLG